jgi:hypothetical protein
MDLVYLFKKHIQDLFPEDTEFISDEIQKIRIRYPIVDKVSGIRKSQPIVLVFDRVVVDSYLTAEKNMEVKILDRYKISLRRLVILSLTNYDPSGPVDVAHRIEIDDRATDL